MVGFLYLHQKDYGRMSLGPLSISYSIQAKRLDAGANYRISS